MTLVLAIAIPWVSAILLMGLDGRRRWVGWAAVGAGVASGVAITVLAGQVLSDGRETVAVGDWPEGIGIALRADALGVVFALVSTWVTVVALISEVLAGPRTRTFPALMLMLCAGLTGLFLTGDVFSFYVFFELSMIAGYVLAGYGDSPRQIGGALIFAVVNLLGSFLFLIAIAGLYHVTGTLDMVQVADRLADVEASTTLVLAASIFVAFGVKLGLFPFHFWLPAVYIGAAPAVAVVLSGALANIGSYGLLRFGAGLLPRELELGGVVLIVLGGVSLVYGALQAVARRNTDEVLAYSAIGQVGYFLVALGIGGSVGLAAAVLYMLVNALNKTLLFLSAELGGALVAAAFAIGALSVAGVPPTAGFLAKAALFQTGTAASTPGARVAIIVLIVLGGALSFLYMFQLYQHDFWRGKRSTDASPLPLRAVALGVALVVLALGVWPEPLLWVSDQAALTLIGAAR